MNHTKRHHAMTLLIMASLALQPLTAEAPPVETQTDTQSSQANNISTQSCGVYVTVDPHICRNVDDDQTPDSEDYELWDIDHDPSAGENDLKPITITGHAGPTGGTMTLEIIAGGDKINYTFWKNTQKADQEYYLSWLVPPNSSRSVTLYIEGFANSDVPKDVKFRATINCPAGTVRGTNYSACSSTDYAETAVYEVDLDIDSENNNGFDPTGYTAEEDKIEASEREESGSKKPGKIIITSPYENLDSDIIFDYWDMNISGKNFVPIQVKLSPAFIPSKAVVNFSYLASPPTPDSILGIFSPLDEGGMRLWKNDAPTRTVSDYIPANTDISWSNLPHINGDPHTAILYVQYVDKKQPEAAGKKTTKVTAKNDKDDDNECHDEVNVTLLTLEINAIAFNYDSSGANTDGLNIRENFNTNIVIPEYISGGQNKPAAYIKGSTVKINLRLTTSTDVTSLKIKGLTTDSNGVLGNAIEKTVIFNSGVSKEGADDPATAGIDESEYIKFDISGNIPNKISRSLEAWNWTITELNGKAVPDVVFQETKDHLIYVLLDTPKDPWNQILNDKQNPWISALEFATVTNGANGKANQVDAMDIITKNLYKIPYNGRSQFYMRGTFNYSGYMNATLANCLDSAVGLDTTASVLGVDIIARRRTNFFNFNFHCFAKMGNSVYDSCSAMTSVIIKTPEAAYLAAGNPGATSVETNETYPIK